jgi:polysaccharide pyruvyl transferase WcaK-like protein
LNVLIEQSGYELRNFGDMAMLQVTAERVRKRWPDAQISIMTAVAESVTDRIPDAIPIMIFGRDALSTPGRLFGKLSSSMRSFEGRCWSSMPRTAERFMALRTKIRGKNYPNMAQYRDAVLKADCVISSGGGFITDVFPDMVTGVCGTLAMAQRYGKPTAMFGQGIGPLTDPYLIGAAKMALPNLKTLGLREPVASPQVALDLGVPADRTTVTGDDATMLGWRQKRDHQGDAIGLNVRVAGYSNVKSEELDALRNAVKTIATSANAPLIPITISEVEQDGKQSASLCPPGHPMLELPMASPIDAINAVSQCRMVITGSYHAAVFALSQGIPVIGLAKSKYYVGKFEGLKGLYDPGMTPFLLSDIGKPGSLRDIAAEIYERAPSLKDGILAKSEELVKRSENLYSSFFDSL